MRTRALILLIPFVVFLTETASFIPAMEESCAMIAAEQSSCCMKEMNNEGQCGDKKTGNKENSENTCGDNADCTTCPVCYTFIFQPQYEWHAKAFVHKKTYSLLTANYISNYTTDAWKPPNGFFYYA
ncbi:MAG: hypothetical protein ABIR78_15180 [Ferruginibacter sp.]